MLSNEVKYQNKVRFLELLTKLNIDITNLTKYLDSDRVDYFNKPYSTSYQHSYAGGLCEQALKFYDELTRLCNLYFPGRYTEEDLIKLALFKDLYKAELFEAFSRNVKDEATGQWNSVVSYRNKEVRPVFGDVGFSSYMIAKKFINLDKDEIVEAMIFGNNGSAFDTDIHSIRADYPLVTLSNMAEMATLYLEA